MRNSDQRLTTRLVSENFHRRSQVFGAGCETFATYVSKPFAEGNIVIAQDTVTDYEVLGWLSNQLNVAAPQLSGMYAPELIAEAQCVVIERRAVMVFVLLAPIERPTSSAFAGTLSFWIRLGSLPKLGVAALLRKLLIVNLALARAHIGLREQPGDLWLVEYPRVKRTQDGRLIVDELTSALDATLAEYYEHVAQLGREFALDPRW